MKTAISLPDEIFEAADELAREMGVSRSQLYSRAVAQFLAEHRPDDVTQRLDAIYGRDGELSGEGLDPVLAEMQAHATVSLDDDAW